VPAAAVINLGADSVSIYPGESYVISPQTNCVNFLWFPTSQINDTTASSPIVNPINNTTYIVTASTEAGCITTDSIKVLIAQKDSITVPNAFTPGSGTNSLFSILSIGAIGNVSLLYFRIYNRWGNMVFETKNIEDGWDGAYNGKPQPQGVYVYEIEAESIEGEVFQRQGNVTLLR
jgi:gliding motility-associated-like protein